MVLENLKNIPEDIEKDILALKPIKVGKKEIYPLVKVIEINRTRFHAGSIEPIALLVVENDGKYLISLNENEPSPELLDMVSI
jgi:hypothetical protein